jgi:hypothetical protein
MSCYLKVILFVSGTGSDASSFRPNMDETQWWNRRDALVRCVASFLCNTNTNANNNKELILLFDQDWSRLQMTVLCNLPATATRVASKDNYGGFVPTEETVIALWRRSCQNPGVRVTQGNLTCTLIKNLSGSSCNTLPSDKKREILQYLQANCSMEFLRLHKLNSSAAAVLKNTNKKSLVNIWNQWKQSSVTTTTTTTEPSTVLASILNEILQPNHPETERVLVGTLHETSDDELPCWNQQPPTNYSKHTQICLFLGAVRDMTEFEDTVLQRVCPNRIRLRLGPVAEFTSKILSVVAFHHANHVLEPAMEALASRSVGSSSSIVPRTMVQSSFSISAVNGPSTLYFLCLVPYASTHVVFDLKHRCHLWPLIRSVVACLWRSRMSATHKHESRGDTTTHNLNNQLLLLFADGVALTLNSAVVRNKAELHQAAPSEYQVLKLIREQLAAAEACETKDGSCCSKRDAQKLVTELTGQREHAYVVSIQDGEDRVDLASLFYASSESNVNQEQEQNCSTVFVVFSILNCDATAELESLQCAQRERWLIRAFQTQDHVVVVNAQHVMTEECTDRLAMTITLLQHFVYQRRLLPMLQQQQNSGSKVGKSRKKQKVTPR